MKISELIKVLKDYKKEFGQDLEVIMASDPEGNGYGSIDKDFSVALEINKNEEGILVIYPFNTFLVEDIFKEVETEYIETKTER